MSITCAASTDLRLNDNGDGIANVDFSDNTGGTVARSHRLVGGIQIAPGAAGTLNLNGVGVLYWGIFADASGSFSHNITNDSTVGGVLNVNVTQTFGETINTTDTTLIYGGAGAINLNGPIVTVFPELRTVSIVKSGENTVRSTGANAYNGSTTVEAGTLVFTNDGTKNAWNSALTSVAGTDIKGGKLVLEYSGTATTPATEIATLLDAAYDSNFATGQIHSSTAVAGQFGLGWTDDTANSRVTIAYARYGDANLDTAVNFDDLLTLAQNYDSTATGKVWGQGDFNYDGSVNFDDLLVLAQGYGSGALNGQQTNLVGADFAADFALAQSLVVPEPTGVVALVALAGLRRRR